MVCQECSTVARTGAVGWLAGCYFRCSCCKVVPDQWMREIPSPATAKMVGMPGQRSFSVTKIFFRVKMGVG